MTTEEFIEAVNALDIDDRNELEAYNNGCGDIFLQTFDEVPIALLGKHYINWDIRSTSQVTIPTKVLKLMVELAESREEENKYVILNGKPFLLEGNISTRVFLINEGNLSFATVSLDEVIDFAYTKEELEQLKTTLPKKLQDAVDLLTVTVGEAKKVLKHDH
ncbi:hypothetical protein [Lactobacillus delbrueckii]|uniref:hypothetical protein n=1 Tax=Lactobacillus delbrueckii TaxID=1584 RepID=UPI001F42E3F5|nr:hypothetical protein [Lactobacillus delbrueckii]GHN50819.1 hypothetical protein ME801_04880 [Lactobacillus delbrueckii]